MQFNEINAAEKSIHTLRGFVGMLISDKAIYIFFRPQRSALVPANTKVKSLLPTESLPQSFTRSNETCILENACPNQSRESHHSASTATWSLSSSWCNARGQCQYNGHKCLDSESELEGDVLRAGATRGRKASSTGVVQVQVEQNPNGIGEEFLEEYDCWRE